MIPNPIVLSAFPDAISRMNFLGALQNTLFYAVFAVIGTLVSCSLVAYGFAIVKWPGRDIVFVFVLATMMLPTQVTLIPLYVIYAKLGWINTYLPLIIPAFLGTPFFIFLLRQFFRGIPSDLIDAARIDGASDLRILTRIVVPLSKPALITVGLLTFIDKWNDFYGPLIYLQKPELRPLALALQVFQAAHQTQWPQMMAASVLIAAPARGDLLHRPALVHRGDHAHGHEGLSRALAISRDALALLLSFREPAIALRSSETAQREGYVFERLELELEGAGRVRAFLTRPARPGGR